MHQKSAVWPFISCVAFEKVEVFVFILIICYHYLGRVSFLSGCVLIGKLFKLSDCMSQLLCWIKADGVLWGERGGGECV